MEKHFCTFINYQQDDGSDKLTMAKFVTNNNELTSTKVSPFFATKNLHSHISFDIVEISNTSIHEQIFKQKILNISRNIEST